MYQRQEPAASENGPPIAVRPEDEEDFIRLLFRSLTGKQKSLFRFSKHAVVSLRHQAVEVEA